MDPLWNPHGTSVTLAGPSQNLNNHRIPLMEPQYLTLSEPFLWTQIYEPGLDR